MPHKDAKSAGANGARRQNETDNRTETKDSTPVSHGTAEYTPEERKSPRDERRAALLEAMASAPSPWRRLSEVLEEAAGDELLRELLEAGRHVDAEPGDGAAAFLPGGEVLLFLVTPEGLEVRRHATDDELRLFLGRAEVAA